MAPHDPASAARETTARQLPPRPHPTLPRGSCCCAAAAAAAAERGKAALRQLAPGAPARRAPRSRAPRSRARRAAEVEAPVLVIVHDLKTPADHPARQPARETPRAAPTPHVRRHKVRPKRAGRPAVPPASPAPPARAAPCSGPTAGDFGRSIGLRARGRGAACCKACGG